MALWRYCGFLLQLALLASVTLIPTYAAAPERVHASNPCFNQSCGNAISNISYPFRVSTYKEQCSSFNSYFDLECVADKQSGVSKLYVLYNQSFRGNISNYTFTQLEVVSFQNNSLIVDYTHLNATLGYNSSDANKTCNTYWRPPTQFLLLPPVNNGAPFVLSKENQFVGMGCAGTWLDTTGIVDTNNNLFKSEAQDTGGCSLVLPDDQNNSACNGGTCCVYVLSSLSLISGIRYAPFWIQRSNAISDAELRSDLCTKNCDQTYANLFHPDYTRIGGVNDDPRFLVKLDWAIPLRGLKASPAKNSSQFMAEWEASIQNLTTSGSAFVCHANATPISDNGVPGYRCLCRDGFEGDGYINGTGCENINECANSTNNDCIKGKSNCIDTPGSYTCQCISKLHRGDGKSNGSGCNFSMVATISFSISSGITFILLVVLMLYFLITWWHKKQKTKYFEQNGGFQLQAYMKRTGRDTTKLFTIEELKHATNNFSDDMKIGVGGFGTVFKGVLEDGRIVAIKKANKYEDTNNNQFLNEISIVTQINHRHIVKLLGTCLETSTPLLVYEYVSNGNLAENLEKGGGRVMTWKERLKIAKQVAEALAYLHGAASPPILHRDVKTTNVLLDNNYDAKVVDFGVSRLIPEGIEHVSTAVQGTLGYLDPEYFQTLQLTDKSDVYSLGVLLAELITSLKPVDTRNREPCFSNLALLFIHHMKENNIKELIDPRLFLSNDEDFEDLSFKIENSILDVASLTKRCLALHGFDRPPMKVVANDLNHIYNSLLTSDDVDEASIPLLRDNGMYEVGGVVVENEEFYAQSISNTMPINSMVVDIQPIPR